MAARLHRLHQDDIRRKIQASVIIDRLEKHVKGELELTATQISAAQTLLDRSVAKLSQIQHTGADGGPIELAWPLPQTSLDQ